MGYFPTPGNVMYSASKTYMQSIFESLYLELKMDQRCKNKIEVLTYSPGFVDTKINNVSNGIGVPMPLEAAEAALKDIGRTNHTYAVFSHEI